VRIVLVAAALAVLTGPAVAGEPYVAPTLQAAQTLEPPADLRADAIALLKAVQSGDLDAVGGFIAPKVTVVSGALDLGLPRSAEKIDTARGGRSAVAGLGNHTGGDWDIPPGADITKFLADMELDFIEGSLTDGRPWGTDPMLPGTVCTYGVEQLDPAAIRKVADRLGVDGAAFVTVADGTPVLDKPRGKQVGTLPGNALYALDYDTDTDGNWMALHLPQGGVGFITVGEDGLQKPYADGLCFKKTGGKWKVVGQSSTGL